MNKQIKWWVIIVLALIGMIIYAPNDISMTINEKMDKYQIEDIARQFLEKNGYDLNNFYPFVRRMIDYTHISYLKSKLEKEKVEEIIQKDLLPDLRWQVAFRKNLPRDQAQTTYRVNISSNGKILSFARWLPDTLSLVSVEEQQARSLATAYIEEQTSYCPLARG